MSAWPRRAPLRSVGCVPAGTFPCSASIKATAQSAPERPKLAVIRCAPMAQPRFPGVDRAGRDRYRIGSTRHDDASICVVGHREVSGAGRADGEWYAPQQLATVRGLIGRVGIPPRLQAVAHQEKLAIHLIGYETEGEIMSAATSLRRVSAD